MTVSSESPANPLVGLAIAVIYAILYMLDSIKALVTWLTITVPSMIVRMLQYSLTISLGFPTLFALTIGSLIGLTFVIRYRYLARYTQLKEPALPPPSPPSLTNELLPIPSSGLVDGRNRSAAFHNYLDDFLAAIRIFGYLEKPVFHELSRHLQTRRLAAGESLEIGGGEFWCVVEGKVQIFAPSTENQPPSVPSTPNPFESSDTFNGYLLLNEVSTGGTLSSLFSILSLFTEDIKLSWESTPEPPDIPNSDAEDIEENPEQGDMTVTEDQDDGGDGSDSQRRRKPRQDSDVSQLSEAMSKRLQSTPPATSPGEARPVGRRSYSAGSSPVVQGGGNSPPTASISETSTSVPGTKSTSPLLQPVNGFSPGPVMPLSGQTSLPMLRKIGSGSRRDSPPTQDGTPRSHRSASKPKRPGTGTDLLRGTIARATVDTTLAVIPAEAFRKLTKKYPKASGTVVQVVLERFSRVTFMTAHKFLGLTREILRSESSLNALVSHPLPREFYTSGGIDALRARFAPRSNSGSKPRPPSDDVSMPRVLSKDYFNFVPTSPTIHAPSLPSITPRMAMTPNILSDSPIAGPSALPRIDTEKAGLSVDDADVEVDLSPETARRFASQYVRQNSAIRKQVAAGDLAMSNMSQDGVNGGAFYRKSAQTPGLPRQDTWRGMIYGSKTDLPQSNGVAIDSTSEEAERDAEIREAILLSIAKSIGLIQPSQSHADSFAHSSLAPSVSASSPPMSPMFPATGRRGVKSPFGNVLDMLNASTNNDTMLGGMLREAVMSTPMDDDASNLSVSMFEGNLAAQDLNKSMLRDLEGVVEILYFRKDSTLVKEGERSPGIYYVIDGFLDVSIPTSSAGAASSRSQRSPTRSRFQANSAQSPTSAVNGRPFGSALGLDPPEQPRRSPDKRDGRSEELLFTVKPGGLAGYLASLCASDSYVHIKSRAKTDCFVGFLPIKDLERILEKRPIVLLTLAKRLLSLLSPLVLHIDAGLDWMQLNAGQVLYEKGDRSSDFYIVINGRLRALDDSNDTVKVLREYGQSDSIGELDVITAAPRSETIHAIRDSELVRIPAALFDAISIQHPATTVQFMRVIAGRVRQALGDQSVRGGDSRISTNMTDVNLKTICIIGTNRSVPVAQFASRLKTSLEELGASTSYLDQGTVMRHLGRHAFARIGQLKIAGWLADQEQHYRSVLYVADTPPSSQWTLTCVRQADLVLILAMGDDPSLGEYEKLILATKTTARKELILLHDERAVAPGSTRPWLRNRPWLHAHHHVELPGVVTPTRAAPPVHDAAAVAAFKHLRERVETRIRKYRGLRPLRPRRPPHMNDFTRIARRICGKQIGVVLGGGGARGISHIGMLQALEEYGIPVDAIAGCSIGSFVGGLYARETDILETTGRTKQFAGRMGSMWRILSDVTYPFASYTTGHEFNRGIYKAFYNTQIEDFWIPFFANSTNITHSRMEIHRSGYAWRYVRASMTLAGLLPPLSDNGNLLVDGGYMDNTPIGPLRANGIQDIFVIDVGAVEDTSPRNYGDSVSGWWIFINKLNPFYKRSVLSMTEVSSRLAYVSSVKTLEDVKNDPHCLYLSMPVQQFETLGGFKQFNDVLAVGVKAGREALRGWKDDGRLPSGMVEDIKGPMPVPHGNRLRRMSI